MPHDMDLYLPHCQFPGFVGGRRADDNWYAERICQALFLSPAFEGMPLHLLAQSIDVINCSGSCSQ